MLYIDVCALKIIAISMVVVAHYFRFFEPTSYLSGLKSIGFFGAALFAFLSGYLADINKESKIIDKIAIGNYIGRSRAFVRKYTPCKETVIEINKIL